MPDQAPNIDIKPGDKGRLVYDKARRTIVAERPVATFDDWFLKFSSWGLSHEQLVHASIRAPGDDPGDVVYTSQSGSVMTRHICSHWINFYSAASAGWNAALSRDSQK